MERLSGSGSMADDHSGQTTSSKMVDNADWVLEEKRSIVITVVFKTFGSVYSFMQENLNHHKLCANSLQIIRTCNTFAALHAACSFCSNTMKERCSSNGLLQETKHGCTTMNMMARDKGCSQNSLHLHGPTNMKLCLHTETLNCKDGALYGTSFWLYPLLDLKRGTW